MKKRIFSLALVFALVLALVPSALADTVIAAPNAAKVLVNGKEVAFDAYTINQENYFKLRDVGYVFNGTRVQFDAAWDGAANMIRLTSNKAYTPDGSEMKPKGTGNKTAALNKSKILLDGKEVELTAYTIEGNNYFRMRELAQTFDFYVGYDGTIIIDTTKLYSGETPAVAKTFKDITAAQWVAGVKVGWNYCGLEAHDSTNFDGTFWTWFDVGGDRTYKNFSLEQLQTMWENHIITKANIDTIKNAGFNAIRIPVTWYKAVDANYNIRADWMARVKEVVNYAVANDMYIILNTQHDEASFFGFLDADMPKTRVRVEKIWKQIAEAFKDYDEKLIFEAFNEPSVVEREYSTVFAGDLQVPNNINAMNQLFVNTVRATGGNNAKRVLMVTGVLGGQAPDRFNTVVMPKDTAENKLIFSIHIYEPNSFCLPPAKTQQWSRDVPEDVLLINEFMNNAYNFFISKGIPVIAGEFGVPTKNNDDYRVAWIEYVMSEAKARGIKCFWWDIAGTSDNGIYDQYNNSWYHQHIVDAIMRSAR